MFTFDVLLNPSKFLSKTLASVEVLLDRAHSPSVTFPGGVARRADLCVRGEPLQREMVWLPNATRTYGPVCEWFDQATDHVEMPDSPLKLAAHGKRASLLLGWMGITVSQGHDIVEWFQHAIHRGRQPRPYEILGPLGAGGIGEVYKARDSRLGRIVAVKIVPHHLLSSAARERFERERRVVASLNHPHICTLHDIGNQDGVDYLVMEYLEGETLPGKSKIERTPFRV